MKCLKLSDGRNMKLKKGKPTAYGSPPSRSKVKVTRTLGKKTKGERRPERTIRTPNSPPRSNLQLKGKVESEASLCADQTHKARRHLGGQKKSSGNPLKAARIGMLPGNTSGRRSGGGGGRRRRRSRDSDLPTLAERNLEEIQRILELIRSQELGTPLLPEGLGLPPVPPAPEEFPLLDNQRIL